MNFPPAIAALGLALIAEAVVMVLFLAAAFVWLGILTGSI